MCSLRKGQRLLSPNHGRGDTAPSHLPAWRVVGKAQICRRDKRPNCRHPGDMGHFLGDMLTFTGEEEAMGERAAFSFLPSTLQNKHVHISPRV